MTEALVRVEGVSKKFCRSLRKSLWYGMQDLGSELRGRQHGHHGQLRPDEFWAVKDVSFELKRGECLGLIGHNGAGKTTLLRMLNGLIKPDSGRIEMRGRIGALIALGAGFHPLLTGRENVRVNASVLGFKKSDIDARFDEIVDFSGLQSQIDSPVQNYSSGMNVRLGFAIAAHLEPDILLVDEALAVGDLEFTVKCLNRVATLRRGGTGVIFVSHSELQVREAAQRCLVMRQGEQLFDGQTVKAYDAYHRSASLSHLLPHPDAGYVHKGPVTITDVTVQGHIATAEGQTGKPLEIDLTLSVATLCNASAFELRFWNDAGQLLSTIGSELIGFKLDLPAGLTRLNVSIPELNLPPGRYRLAAGFRRNGEVLGWTRDLASIYVQAPQPPWLGIGTVPLRADVTLQSYAPLITSDGQ